MEFPVKCVRNVAFSEVKRVRDEQAEHLVKNSNVWVYCPKSDWKKQVRGITPVAEENKEAVKAGLDKKAREKKSRQDKVNYHKDKKSHK